MLQERRTDVLVARSASILLPEAERKLRRRVLITISASPATVGIFLFFFAQHKRKRLAVGKTCIAQRDGHRIA